MKFVVLHEFAHILLRHERKPAGVLRDQFTDVQIATFSIGDEFQADELALRMFARMEIGKPDWAGIEFAGIAALFGVLGVLERYINIRSTFDAPHAHPAAYERLYRMRLEMGRGGPYKYWNVTEDGKLQLARMELVADPRSVSFADMISSWFLDVARAVETNIEKSLPSPINELFLRYSNDAQGAKQLIDDLLRWIAVGSPEVVLRGLAEMRANAEAERNTLPETDRERSDFLRWAVEGIDAVFARCGELDDHFIRRALAVSRDYVSRLTDR